MPEALERTPTSAASSRCSGVHFRRHVEHDAVLVCELTARREADRVPQLLRLYCHVRMVSDAWLRPGRLVRCGTCGDCVRSSETECYVRLYGGWDPTVTLVKIEPRRPRYELAVSGEDLRREFEARIEARARRARGRARRSRGRRRSRIAFAR